MKESIGGTQIFIIVVTLILIFSGIMALTINHSNAFSVKDQLVSIIERNDGFDMTSELKYEGEDTPIGQIVESLQHNSYRQRGRCPESSDNYEVAAYERNGSKTIGNNKSSFCIVKISGNNPAGTPQSYYYQVIVFYSLDLPVINSFFDFKAIGETKALYS
jgi:hypothetical protein